MKKYITVIIMLIIIIYSNILYLNIDIKFTDFLNLLFLNFRSFENYGLNRFDFRYIVYFYLFLIFLLYFTISKVNETTSFLKMIIYRVGKKKSLLYVIRSFINNNLKLYLYTNCMIILLFIMIQQNYEFCCIDIFVLMLYMCKIFVMLFFYYIYNYYDSLKNYYSSNIIKESVSILLFIILDLIFDASFITFCGNIEIEIIYILIYILISIFIIIINIFGGNND